MAGKGRNRRRAGRVQLDVARPSLYDAHRTSFVPAFARAASAFAACAAVVAVSACSVFAGGAGGGGVGASGDVGAVADLLGVVRVVPERVTVLGYDRSRFGGWAPAGACDTRDAVMAIWFGLASPTESSPAGGCGADARSVIDDPYTGAELSPADADVDHVYPLAAAWDFGAHAWAPAARRAFANDVRRNLVPVAADVNREKSDLTPAEWLPPARGLRCGYSRRYLEVAVAWRLPVSVADWRALAGACGIRAR